jgi:hypothetical protein
VTTDVFGSGLHGHIDTQSNHILVKRCTITIINKCGDAFCFRQFYDRPDILQSKIPAAGRFQIIKRGV